MKTTQIFVGINGATLAGLNAGPGVAVFPPKKGSDKSYILLANGKVGVMKGARIGGVGIPRYLKENNFELAKPGDASAEKLADYVDTLDGKELVSAAVKLKSEELQTRLGGQRCTFVPFDSAKEICEVQVEPNCRTSSVRFDMASGFSAAMVKTVYEPGNKYFDISLVDGWLVGPGEDTLNLPRMTEAKELIEHAVFIMCASGMGTLVEASNLTPPESMADDEVFARGSLKLLLANGDYLVTGGTADDLLATQYFRDGAVLYSRTAAISAPQLGAVVGDIAAVLVRVAEMDAQLVAKTKKKAA